MNVPFYIILLAIIYTVFWIGGFFITLFQMAEGKISEKVLSVRYNVFFTMFIVEIILILSLPYIMK